MGRSRFVTRSFARTSLGGFDPARSLERTIRMRVRSPVGESRVSCVGLWGVALFGYPVTVMRVAAPMLPVVSTGYAARM
jgi:hypothetical protein